MSKTDPAYLLYRVGSAIASAFPQGPLFKAARGAAQFASKRNNEQRETVRRNMRRATGRTDVEDLVDEAYASYARYWVEALRMPKPGPKKIRERTTVEGLEHISSNLEKGQGVILVLPHVGSYDVAGAWLASHGFPIIAVAEQLEPPELFEMFTRLRASVGVEIVPAGKGSSARALLNGLRNGKAVGLVADRDISGSGIDVEFFGEVTQVPAGPAVLAMRTGAPIVVCALFQRPGERYHGVVFPPIEVEQGKSDPARVQEITKLFVRQMEELIRRDPGQWHLFQPNWPSDPGYRHSSGPEA